MTTHTLLRTSLVLLLFLAGACFGTESPVSWESEDGQKLEMKDLIPVMGKREKYSEQYDFHADLDDGGRLRIAFTISNLGWGDGRGAVQIELERPDAADYSFREKFGRGEWSYDKNTFKLKIANTSVEATSEDTFQLTHEGDLRIEVRFRLRVPMWSPGQLHRDGRYRRVHIICPRGDVTGKVSRNGTSEEISADGSGYADHTVTNIAPYDLARRFCRFWGFSGDTTVVWKAADLTPDYGGKRVGWIMVARRGRIVFTDFDPVFRMDKPQKDPKTGYEIPRKTTLAARSGKDRVRIVHRMKRVRRRDLLAEYGAFARMIAGAVATPFRFTQDITYSCNMTLNGTRHTMRGDARLLLDYLKK